MPALCYFQTESISNKDGSVQCSVILPKLLKAGDKEQDLDEQIHPLIAGGRSENLLLGVLVLTVPPFTRYDPNSLGYHNGMKKASPEARSLSEVRSLGKLE